jgi:hypothetical protein
MPDAPKKKQRVVKYRHSFPFTARIISAEDWEMVGAKDHEGVRWDIENGHRVPIEKFSPEALAYIERDDDLTIVEI